MRDTSLLLERVPPERITVAFLVDVMDLAELHDLPIEAISVYEEHR